MNHRSNVSRLLAAVSLFLSAQAWGNTQVPAHLCQRTQADAQKLALDPQNRVAIENRGGWQDGGVCWWHSRLQRSALYLAMYRPDLPKPTRQQAMGILEALIDMDRVVIIPGYANLAQFTADYPNEIIHRLGTWQTKEFFTRFNWWRAIKGSADVHPDTMKYIAEKIDDMVNHQHRIPFERLNIKGQVTNHAWLFIGSQKTVHGYRFTVIDSNYPLENLIVDYRFGDTHLKDPHSSWTFVPYLDYEKELNRMLNVVNRWCGRK